jgi:hypothetical protein
LFLPYPGPPIHCAVLQSNAPACFTSLLHSSLLMRSARSIASARLSNSKYLSSASIRLPASAESWRQAVRVSLRCTSFIGASIAVMGALIVVAMASIKSDVRPMVAVRYETYWLPRLLMKPLSPPSPSRAFLACDLEGRDSPFPTYPTTAIHAHLHNDTMTSCLRK